jgi:hypothetical protein
MIIFKSYQLVYLHQLFLPKKLKSPTLFDDEGESSTKILIIVSQKDLCIVIPLDMIIVTLGQAINSQHPD